VGFEQNILIDEPLEHALGAADQGVEIERAGAADLAPSEGEQLLGEGGRALAGAANFLNRRSLGIVCRKVVEEHVAVAVDDGQQVVEVVGNAAGEASDGLHFLRLQQLFLQAAALRGIAQDSVYGHRLAVLAHDVEVDLNDQQPAALDLDL